MKQGTLSLNLNVKMARKQVFPEQMEQVVPWADLVELIAPYYPEGKTGRPMLGVYYWNATNTLSDIINHETSFQDQAL